MENTELDHPYSAHDALNDHLYDVARKVDELLNKEPVENHAAIVGLVQVTVQRRMHEHQQDQQRAQMEAQQKVAAANRFGVH